MGKKKIDGKLKTLQLTYISQRRCLLEEGYYTWYSGSKGDRGRRLTSLARQLTCCCRPTGSRAIKNNFLRIWISTNVRYVKEIILDNKVMLMPMLRIRDILVRVRIHRFVTLTNGSGLGCVRQ
jgi:hypothetical protein